MRIRSKPRPGLTLIEVMLGLVIMLLALVAIGRLVDMGTDSANEGRLTARANRLAESKLAEVEAGAVPFDSSGGTFEPEEPSWSWSLETQQPGPANLYQVTVRVYREVSGRRFEVSLTQMILDPQAMGTAAQAEKPAAETEEETTGGTMP